MKAGFFQECYTQECILLPHLWCNLVHNVAIEPFNMQMILQTPCVKAELNRLSGVTTVALMLTA